MHCFSPLPLKPIVPWWSVLRCTPKTLHSFKGLYESGTGIRYLIIHIYYLMPVALSITTRSQSLGPNILILLLALLQLPDVRPGAWL